MTRQIRISPAARAARDILLAGTIAVAFAMASHGPAAQTTTTDDPSSGGACSITSAPRITVVADIDEFAYDHSRSIRQLGQINAASQAAAGHVLGLTRQLFEIANDTTKTVILPRQDGSVCVGFTDGTITVGLKTLIFIVSELEPDSCLYDQVVAHEERHAKVGRRLFTEFAAKLETGIAEALRKTPFVKAVNPAVARTTAEARMREIIDPLFQDFRSVYRKRQAIIDTSGEFSRVEVACPGESRRLTGQ